MERLPGSSSASGRNGHRPSPPSVKQLNDHVYELYKSTEVSSMNILFFHGLQFEDSTEAHLSTWTCGEAPEQIWPSTWLVEEFPCAHVLSISYDSCMLTTREQGGFHLHSLTGNLIQAICCFCMRTTQEQGTFDLQNLTENLIQAICYWANIGQVPSCPVVLVGHSFGGLVIKSLCVEASHSLSSGTPESEVTQNIQRFLQNVRGVFFYGTPHRGSPLFDEAASFLAGPLLPYVRLLSVEAARLESNFAAVCKKYSKWHIASVGESLPTLWGPFPGGRGLVVPEASARYGNFLLAKANHITLCKPTSKKSNSFQHLKTFLQSIQTKEIVFSGSLAKMRTLGTARRDLLQLKDLALESNPYEATVEEKALHMLGQPGSLSECMTQDSRYVAMKISEEEVYKALDNPEGPIVVLLHGGPGKGKSTLARNTMVHYKKGSDVEAWFCHVFFLSCGAEANIEDTLEELMQSLSPKSIPTQEPSKRTRSIRIRHHVSRLLATQKVLIILDDVTDRELLVEIVKLCGRGVKCLVTSQLSNLCEPLQNSEFLKIQIQDIELEDARKILASHIGLLDQQIPENVQELADIMISKTDHNPLALASLASVIDSNRSTDLKEWQDASTYFSEALNREIKASLFHSKYPRTFWTTTKQSIRKLSKRCLNLLFLIHACEGELICEEVVEMLYKGLLQEGAFSWLRKELHDQHLIKIIEDIDFGCAKCGFTKRKKEREAIDNTTFCNLGKRSWSLHSLQKLYIQEEMREARDSIFTSLVVKNNEPSNVESQIIDEIEEEKKVVLTSLCALYLEKGFASMAATNMDIPLDRFNTKRKIAIQPITLLLGLPLKSPTWTKFEQVSARKVFLNYIRNDILDGVNISHLLRSDIAAPLMCKVLRDISFLEESCMLAKTTEGQAFMNVLVTWLDQVKVEGADHGRRKQTMALEVLHAFVGNDDHRIVIALFPGVLEGITTLLEETTSPNNSNHYLQCLAVKILVNLPLTPIDRLSNTVRTKIINHPRLLLELVNSLATEANPMLQVFTAWALGNLASGTDEIRVTIVANSPRIIYELVNSLFKETNKELQEFATEALGKLALGPNEIRVKIASHPRAISKLVHSLSEEANPRLQQNATQALAHLACGADEIKVKIVDCPMAILKLVHSLSKEANPKLQQNAAAALANLAMGLDDIRVKIVDHSMAFSKLVHSLYEETNPILQQNATQALAHLASGADEIKVKIIDHPTTLSKLVHFLSEEANPKLQQNAAIALGNLASGLDDIKIKIVDHSMALSKLVHSLSEEANPKLQENAAYAFVQLVCRADKSEIKVKIANHPMALLKLVHSLFERANPSLQQHAAHTLAHLADIEDESVRLHIKATNGIIEGLLCLLASDNKQQRTEEHAIKVITLLDPIQGNAVHLHFVTSYNFRIYANVSMGLLKEALVDCNEALKLEQEDSNVILRNRCFVRAMMGDYQGALEDADIVVNSGDDPELSLSLQERGVVKRMIGNLHGALEDLNEALTLCPDDYEMLKHRGYVKFCMEDEEGAQKDAEWALRVKPSHVENPRYGKTNLILGCTSVQYLGYKLK